MDQFVFFGREGQSCLWPEQYKIEPLEKYNELQGCREQCAIADLYTEVLIVYFVI